MRRHPGLLLLLLLLLLQPGMNSLHLAASSCQQPYARSHWQRLWQLQQPVWKLPQPPPSALTLLTLLLLLLLLLITVKANAAVHSEAHRQ
jgi:hypothetical protein